MGSSLSVFMLREIPHGIEYERLSFADLVMPASPNICQETSPR